MLVKGAAADDSFQKVLVFVYKIIQIVTYLFSLATYYR